jgi:hypothetical protein
MKQELQDEILGILYANKSDEADEGSWIESKDYHKVAEAIALSLSTEAEDRWDAQELWDKYSMYVDDLSSMLMIAGNSVITKEQFNKLLAEITPPKP